MSASILIITFIAVCIVLLVLSGRGLFDPRTSVVRRYLGTWPSVTYHRVFEGLKLKSSSLGSRANNRFDKWRPKTRSGVEHEHMIERRTDHARRKRIAEMSIEEMRHALLVSENTGLLNRRAFEEGDASAFVAMADLDGLKALNDEFGYAAGDTLICRFAELLLSVGLDVYHFQGDEFVCKGASFQELNEKLCRARQMLREQPFAVCGLDGRVTGIPGADYCFGIGTNLTEAERTLKGQKELRSSSRLPWGFPR